MRQPIKRWKFGLKRCDCVKCESALTIEQTEEDCGWVMWGDVAALAAENERLSVALLHAEAEVTCFKIRGTERQNDDIKPEGSNDAVGRAVEVLLQKEAEIKRLAAENERLRSSQLSLEKWIACEQTHFDTADNLREKLYQASLEVERLRSEVERLRKAGDAMYHTAQQDGTGLWLHKSFQDWLAAKEGKSV